MYKLNITFQTPADPKSRNILLFKPVKVFGKPTSLGWNNNFVYSLNIS